MKNRTTWAGGLVFAALFIHIGFNNFEMPKVFIGETVETTGKIIQIFPNYGVKGSGPFLRVKFAYPVGDFYYVGYRTIGKRQGLQDIGSTVRIKYAVKKPSKYKVLNFKRYSSGFLNTKFYTNKKVGYDELNLENGIFHFIEAGLQGKISKDYTGEYHIFHDTLKLKTYNFAGDTIQKENFSFIIHTNALKMKLLSDINSDGVFYERKLQNKNR